MASDDGQNAVDAINPLTGKLLYKDILHISPFSLFHELSQKYFSKINSQASLPRIVYYIIYCFELVQIIGPSILINIPEIWDPDNVFTQFLQYMASIWQSYEDSERSSEIASVILSCIVLVFCIMMVFYSFLFKTKQTVERYESIGILFCGKYLYALFAPLIAVGFPISIYNMTIDVDFLDIFVIVAGLISLLALGYFITLQSSRLLIEDNPSHEWDSNFRPLRVIVTSTNALLGVTAGLLSKTGKIIIIIVMLVIYLLFGLYTILTVPTIKNQATITIASLEFASSIICLVNLVIFFIGKSNLAVLIVAFIAIIAISLIATNILMRRRLLSLLNFLYMCEEQIDDCQDLLENRWKSPRKFVADMRLGFTSFHPFILSYKPFNYAFQQFPNRAIIQMWCRIVAIFPKDNELFRWLLSQYSNQKEFFNRENYLYQMIELSESRIVITTSKIRKQLMEAEKSYKHIKSLQKRFWENILQKSIDSFWHDVSNITLLMDKLELKIRQLIDNFPNNVDVVEFYCTFLLELKANIAKYKEWNKKLLILKSGNKLKQDFAVHAAQDFLPEVKKLCSEVELTKETMANTLEEESPENSNQTLSEQQNIQLRHSLQDIIEHSHFGNIFYGSILFMIGTVVTLILFSYFIQYFEDHYVNDLMYKRDFINEMDKSIVYLGYLCIYMAAYPLFDSGIISISEVYMNFLAPTLYPAGRVPYWTFEKDDVEKIAAKCMAQLELMSSAFNKLDTNEEAVRIMYETVFVESGTNPSLQALMVKSLLTMITLVSDYPNAKDYLKDPRFIEFDVGFETLTSTIIPIVDIFVTGVVQSKEEVLSGLNSWLVITLVVCFTFMTIPLILISFKNQVDCERVSSLFISIQNTAVRDILDEHGKQEKEKDYDSEETVILSSGKSITNNPVIIFCEFLLTFLAVLIACLYVYFKALTYVDDANLGIKRSAVVHPPIFYTSTSLYRLIRLIHTQQFTAAENGNIPKEFHIMEGLDDIKKAREYFEFGYWGDLSAMNVYYNMKSEIDRFEDLIPVYDPDQMPNKTLSFFEKLATADYVDAAEDSLRMIQQFLQDPPVDIFGDYFIYTMYYIMCYCLSERDDQFLRTIETGIEKVFIGAGKEIHQCEIAIYVIQVAASLGVIAYFITKHLLLRKSLRFFMFFDPEVILKNQNIINLLNGRSMKEANIDYGFKNSEKIIAKTQQCICLLDTNTKITDSNSAFESFVGLQLKNFIGKPIADILKPCDNGAYTIADLIMNTQSIVKGLQATQFNQKLFVSTLSGVRKYISVNVVSLTPYGPATESDIRQIVAIGYIIDDLTEHITKEEVIKQEQQKTVDMLIRVLPIEILDQLQSNTDSISFSVQSASIGVIRINTESPINTMEKLDAPFTMYGKLFKMFDKISEKFSLITRVRTFQNTYTYVSGLFSHVNKPNKHAEEATRFALSLINSISYFEKETGLKIKFRIGLNTGGPLVAGVIGLSKPMFHLIGPPVELAQQLELQGEENTIHASRAVYELVYAYNFNVQDRGDTKIRGDRVIRTYTIQP